eukprot:1705467-Amphidinium_carterae.2
MRHAAINVMWPYPAFAELVAIKRIQVKSMKITPRGAIGRLLWVNAWQDKSVHLLHQDGDKILRGLTPVPISENCSRLADGDGVPEELPWRSIRTPSGQTVSIRADAVESSRDISRNEVLQFTSQTAPETSVSEGIASIEPTLQAKAEPVNNREVLSSSGELRTMWVDSMSEEYDQFARLTALSTASPELMKSH